MAKSKERRHKKRWSVAVLTRCDIPKRDDEIYEMEMWARDVNDEGLKLEWTPGLHSTLVSKNASRARPKTIRFEDVQFARGLNVRVQDLFYDDEGSPFIEGRVLWVRRQSTVGNWMIGVGFAKDKQSRAFISAFRDFLKIVRNPADAIAKASRS